MTKMVMYIRYHLCTAINIIKIAYANLK